MHKYLPRIHLVKRPEKGLKDPIEDLDREPHKTFVFPEAIFTAVTAYQNQLVSILFNHISCLLALVLFTTRLRAHVTSSRRSALCFATVILFSPLTFLFFFYFLPPTNFFILFIFIYIPSSLSWNQELVLLLISHPVFHAHLPACLFIYSFSTVHEEHEWEKWPVSAEDSASSLLQKDDDDDDGRDTYFSQIGMGN